MTTTLVLLKDEAIALDSKYQHDEVNMKKYVCP
jgi:hypothetical protein